MSESESESLTSEEDTPKGPYDPTTIGKLKASEKIYQGTENGSFCFRPHLGEKGGGSTQPMPGSALIALGLTEICCDLGQGKVFYVPKPYLLPRGKAKRKEVKKEAQKAVWAFHRRPDLVYLPFVWGKKDKDDWMGMKHIHRSLLLSARGGSIPLRELVLPINLIYEPVQRATFPVNAYFDEDHAPRATLAILPKAYVWWHSELPLGIEQMQKGNIGYMADLAGAWYEMKERKVKSFQMKDAEDVVQKLRSMYFETSSRSLCRLETIIADIIEFDRLWTVVKNNDKEL
ncbi:MAG: hypothetical protein Q9180_004664 [Flavoplaca navasiana]